jgi:Fe-S-cluster containining protein
MKRHGQQRSGLRSTGVTRSERESLWREVEAIYAELARRPIERDCQTRTTCCRFRLTGKTPHLTKGEALYLAQGCRAAGRTAWPLPADGSCPVLDPRTGSCRAYAHRPFGCRTHFCEAAGGPYARREVLDLIRRLEEIDARLGGAGPQALPVALSQALREF